MGKLGAAAPSSIHRDGGFRDGLAGAKETKNGVKFVCFLFFYSLCTRSIQMTHSSSQIRLQIQISALHS